MNVDLVMTADVKTCRATDSTARAAQLMWEHDCGVIPVVTPEGRAAGIVTDRDLCMAALLRGKALSDLRVDEVMSTRLVTCRPGDSLALALQKMRTASVRRLPVVDFDDRVIGIVTLNDLLRANARGDGRTDLDELLSTAASVCEPRNTRDLRAVHKAAALARSPSLAASPR
jgi:CBS domain-containing protein